MQEFKDGTFGSIAPEKELLEMLSKSEISPELKAIHFGTPDELATIRAKEQPNVEALAAKVAELERRMKPGAIQIFQPEDVKGLNA